MKRTSKKSAEDTKSKLSKSDMESLRRERLRDEYKKSRAIIDARRPNLNCKMEHGDILEQMRLLFLDTEQRLKETETQLATFQQNFAALYAQIFTQGFSIGKSYAQMEPILKAQMANAQSIPSIAPNYEQLLSLFLNYQSGQRSSSSESSFNITFPNNDSGFNSTP